MDVLSAAAAACLPVPAGFGERWQKYGLFSLTLCHPCMFAGLFPLALPELGLKAAGADPVSAIHLLGQLGTAFYLQAALWPCDTWSELQLLALHTPWAW